MSTKKIVGITGGVLAALVIVGACAAPAEEEPVAQEAPAAQAEDESQAKAEADEEARAAESQRQIEEAKARRAAAEEEERKKAEAEAAAEEATYADKASYAEIGTRDFALLVKNPDAYAGDLYVVYGEISQFDAATGTTAFRADVTGQLPERGYDGDYKFWQDGENSIVTGAEGLLAGVVKDDQVKMWVEVDGSFSYGTQIGGETTVPKFAVYHMDIIGRAS